MFLSALTAVSSSTPDCAQELPHPQPQPQRLAADLPFAGRGSLDISSDHVKIQIKARAKSLGFCLCGVTGADEMQDYPVFENWLAEKQNGCMAYLASDRHRFLRKRPRELAPWVKSVILLAWPYALNRASEDAESGQIAGYTGREDYHFLLPRTLQPMLDELPEMCGKPVRAQFFCDSVPILERELGVRAGLGWIGRNSCLISPEVGSAFLLAEIFLDIALPPDSAFQKDRCGNCRRCIDACPVGCINPNRTIDANRCISALTIELNGTIPQEYSGKIGNHLFGCDVCQSACPWNSKNVVSEQGNEYSLTLMEMIELLPISEASFREQFKDSAILRAKRRGLIRNLCAVIGNLKGKAGHDNLLRLLQTDPDPIIRISAASALLKINPDDSRKQISRFASTEENPEFREELLRLVKQ
jgi:epoxyqueuosine reductase